MARPFISHELAERMRDKLEEIANMSPAEQKGMAYAQKSAADICRFYQTQQGYQLKDQKTPRDYAQASRNPRTLAGKLENLTPEQLHELQRTAVGDYPGKPA